jgi:hypothetical protein
MMRFDLKDELENLVRFLMKKVIFIFTQISKIFQSIWIEFIFPGFY